MSEDVEGTLAEDLRILAMAAGRVGETMARLRENQIRRQEAATAAEQRDLAHRFNAERMAALAQLQSVNDPKWWDQATARDIADNWQVASAWRDQDADARVAHQTIHREVGSRYGLDLSAANASDAEVRAAFQRSLEELERASAERAQYTQLEREALELLLEADAMRDSRDQVPGHEVERDIAREDTLRDQAASLQRDADAHRGLEQQHKGTAYNEAERAKITADKGFAVTAAEAVSSPSNGAGARKRAHTQSLPTRKHEQSR